MFAPNIRAFRNLHKFALQSDGLPRFRSDDRGSAVKILNYSNKVLYGGVSRQPNGTKRIVKAKSDTPAPASPSPSPQNDLSSEMYWLLQHKPGTSAYPRKSAAKRSAKPVVKKREFAADEELLSSVAAVTKLTKNAATLSKKRSRKTPAKTIPTSLSRFSDTLCKPPLKSLATLAAANSSSKQQQSATTSNSPVQPDDLRQMLRVPPFANGSDGHSTRIAGEPQVFLGCGQRLDIAEMPSVGKVLQATMPEDSRRALQHWKQLKVAELGADGFAELQKSHLTHGSNFHAALQTYFQDKEAPGPQSPLADLWTSCSAALVSIDAEPALIEAPIVHPVLQYKGIVDCVSNVNGELTVIEWKKSDRPKATLTATYDAPLQLCAYLGAINADSRYSSVSVRSGLVVIAYTSGAPAHAFRLSEATVQHYWLAWLRRLHEYWRRRRCGTLPEPI